jgi:hypothetical protein
MTVEHAKEQMDVNEFSYQLASAWKNVIILYYRRGSVHLRGKGRELQFQHPKELLFRWINNEIRKSQTEHILFYILKFILL